MNVGFAAIARQQGVEFRLFTPQSSPSPASGNDPYLSLVNFAQTPDSAAVLMGRLYYRDEQIKKLDAPPAVLAEGLARNDAALALAVYHRAGREGIEALEGDFSLVVWDAVRKTLLGLRDPNGGYPLFWMEQPGIIALSTGLVPLVGLLPKREIDMEYVADFLMLPGANGEELAARNTAFHGINRVGPGQSVAIRQTDGNAQIDQRLYWDWREHVTAPRGNTLPEIADEYGHTLRAAVRERMRGITAAHFSGGMDSTALALLARDEAVIRGDGPVHALALIYKKMAVLIRESEYLELALQGQEGLAVHRVPADDVLDFAMMVDPPPHDEPWTWLTRGGMNGVLLDAAAGASANTVLSGIGADELLSSTPFMLADLVRRGRLIAAWRESKSWARGKTSSPWNILYPHGIVPLLPFSMRGGIGPMIKSILRRRSTLYKDQTQSSIPPWISPKFAASYGLRKRAIVHMRQWMGRVKGFSESQSSGLAAIRGRSGDMSRWHSAAPRGIHVAHPFLDPRVLSLSLGIPDPIRSIPGVQKPVLGQAMRDVLPQDIRATRRKGHFNEAYNLGLSHYLPDLEKIAIDAPVENLGLFDKKIFLHCLNEAALIGGGNIIAEGRINLSLSLMQWLSHIDRWIAEMPAPTAVIKV